MVSNASAGPYAATESIFNLLATHEKTVSDSAPGRTQELFSSQLPVPFFSPSVLRVSPPIRK
jgi:hypothetical protein